MTFFFKKVKFVFIKYTKHLKPVKQFYFGVLEDLFGVFFVYTKNMSERNALECNDFLLLQWYCLATLQGTTLK